MRSLSTAAFVWLVLPLGLGAADWPMWRYDAARSAASPEGVADNPSLLWSRELGPVRQAWPLEASQRLSFDASYEPVVMGKLLFVGSPNDGSVAAYDTETGEEHWRSFTEGPVRCAPACWQGKVYAGSDDGFLYCLNAQDGTLLWRVRGAPAARPDRRHLGNGQLVSFWPVRGGPVVVAGVVYFGAGVWPIFGVFLHALDAETGTPKWTNHELSSLLVRVWRLDFDQEAGLSPQGCFAVAGDRLVVPNGRSMPASLDLKTGKLVYYSQCRRNGDSRVATHGRYAFFGKAGVLRLDDFQEVGTEVFDEVEAHGPPYVKTATACDASSAFENNVAYGATAGVFYAYDLDRATLVGTGPEPAGSTLSGKPTIKRLLWQPPVLWELKTPYAGQPSAGVIRAGTRLYGSAGQELLALEAVGNSPRLVWQKSVGGTPTSLIAADGKLFVATREGRICCFGAAAAPAAGPKTYDREPPAPEGAESRWGEKVRQIVAATGVKAGYCLVLGLTDGRLVTELLKQTELCVVGADPDARRIDGLRRDFAAAGVYGTRLQLFAASLAELPFPPYIASLIVSEDAQAAGLPGQARADALFSHLRPYGGTLCLELPPAARPGFAGWAASVKAANAATRQVGDWSLLIREGALPGSAPWTHEAADAGRSFCSRDDLVRAPLGFLWYGDMNGFTQANDYGVGVKPQVFGGRVFALQQHSNRVILFCYDAYTGRPFWKTETMCLRAHARFAVAADGVYLVANGTCRVLDPATGEELRTFPFNATGATVAKDIRLGDSVIVVAGDAVTESEMAGAYFQAEAFNGTGYYNSSELVCLDRRRGAELWRRQAKDRFSNAAIAMGAGLLFVADSLPMRAAGKWQTRTTGLSECESRLFALDPATGREVWSATSQTRYTEGGEDDWIGYSPETGILLSGRQATLRAFEAATGKPRWEKRGFRPGPFILRGSQFVAQCGWQYDMRSGERVGGQEITRPYWGGCNYMVGSTHLEFRRLGSVYYRDVHQGREFLLRNIRSGCSNSLIPADGLLNAPNYSQYCFCNYGIQTSFAMIEMPEVEPWDSTTPYPVPPPPAVAPRGASLKLGPFALSLVDVPALAEDLTAGRIETQPWLLQDESRLEWVRNPTQSAWYDVVLLKASKTGAPPQAYALQTEIVSEREQAVDVQTLGTVPGNPADLAAWLNRDRIPAQGQVQLRAGANRLVLLYWGQDTAFIQFLKAGTPERVDGIRYELPGVAGADVIPYQPRAAGPVASKALAGTWRATLVRKLKSSLQDPVRDEGPSEEARQRLGADVVDRDWQQVQVPLPWEKYGGDWAEADGEAVFRRTVNVPAEWAGRELVLSLGPIDDFDDTFWNGVLVGRTDSTVPKFYAVPRNYRIPANLVTPGPAVIAVRVFDHGGDGGLVGRPEDLAVSLATPGAK